MARKARTRRNFGSIRKLPSGRYQAGYTGPDTVRHNAPATFETRMDAEGWLFAQRRSVDQGEWTPPAQPKAKPVTLAEYSAVWVGERDLKASTRQYYTYLLDSYLLPTFSSVLVEAITPAAVRAWYARIETGPTSRARAYALLKSILATAVEDEIVTTNPCRVRGAVKVTRARQIKPATLDELAVITEAMPDRLRLIVPLSAWCALRFGEAAELRRKDVDLTGGVLRIRRGVVRVAGQVIVSTPKTAAGSRDVHIPPHLLPVVKQHLRDHAQIGADGLLFYGIKGGQLAHSSFLWQFNQAAAAADRPDLTPHALRHTGAVLAAQSGATLAELMQRLGHTTPAMAMLYQHASADRDLVLARAMSVLAAGAEDGP